MNRLIYLSAAMPSLTQRDLDQILSVSRANNKIAGLTGLLLYGRGSFIQVLEGDPADIDACYERIRRDKRHSALLPVLREPIAARSFGEWSMGYHQLRGDERGLEGFINLRDKAELGQAGVNTSKVVAGFISSFRKANIDAA
jgi:Sensors of blue-light using FAD